MLKELWHKEKQKWAISHLTNYKLTKYSADMLCVDLTIWAQKAFL
tara:strand:+ start:526 stop:660 length:135 start_codon:yes stop_codon:yes gene_type:complete